MSALMIGGMALSGLGTVTGIAGGLSGASKAKAAAYHNANLYNEQMLEEIRRKERQHKVIAGTTRAGVYASGIQMTGSAANYVASEEAEMSREIKWMHRHREMSVHAMKKGAQVQYDAAKWRASSIGLQGASNIFSMYNKGSTP